MKKNLLEQVLDFENNKEFYNSDESKSIRQSLKRKLKSKLFKLDKKLTKTIDDFNSL
ncbi:hypothetical protein [Spongiimicrobium salis]|uniref:hypothetical protein n=1 Tax=Spongiimicrobium salis TaxID=1667022 RepID=UPI00374DD9B1